MPQQGKHKSKSHHKSKHRQVPTTERQEARRQSTVQSTLNRTPDPLLYGLAFILVVFGLTFLIVGSVHTKHCELQKMLPIWLLVMGIFLMIAGGWKFFVVRRIKAQPFKPVQFVEKFVSIFIFVVWLGWFIAGNVWVYKAWGERPDFGHTWFSNGCDKSVFFLSFVAVIVMDGILGILLIGCCFWGVSSVVVRE